MARRDLVQGSLQQRVMRVLWRLGEGSVEDVRKGLPPRSRGAYTTIQTVLNRLAARGLLHRERAGNMIIYSPRLSEAEYLAGSLNRTLDGASDRARRAALARLVGDLSPGELEEIRELAREIASKRSGGDR